jgi:hypothetical protein
MTKKLKKFGNQQNLRNIKSGFIDGRSENYNKNLKTMKTKLLIKVSA